VLALVAVVLIDGTVAGAATSVREVATHRALEETLAALARQHAVVLPGTLVATDYTLGVQLQPIYGRGLVGSVARRVGDRGDVCVLLRVSRLMQSGLGRMVYGVVMQLRRCAAGSVQWGARQVSRRRRQTVPLLQLIDMLNSCPGATTDWTDRPDGSLIEARSTVRGDAAQHCGHS